MADQNKPNIVFAHGLWADGSCFQKLIPALQADGHEVMCSQHGLDSLKGDVECVTRCFGRVSAPVVIVGHSYGGTLITHAGTDSRVAALVYIAALAPDDTETSQGLQQKFPVTEVFSHIEVADGRIWLKRSHQGRPIAGAWAIAGRLAARILVEDIQSHALVVCEYFALGAVAGFGRRHLRECHGRDCSYGRRQYD
jgi:pimeloyl-ACP methyl ester carboxylesterase